MNERIRELAEQAGMKPCADMSKFGMNEDMNPYNCQEFMLEKFAELIVEECAELMETQHTWITSVAASTLIRNHFKNEKF